MRTALIDGDSIAYILAWRFRDSDDEALLQYSIDNMIKEMLVLLDASHYVGALSSKPGFRDQVYKYAKYKGTRGPDHEGIVKWKAVINAHLRKQWGFFDVPKLEADDVVAYLSFRESLGERVICSPDKDLKQIPGELYDYAKGVKEFISTKEALYNMHMLMLCGDETDNIKGVPGIGPVKARSILALAEDTPPIYDQYVKYFGKYYGSIIHEETRATVMVMQPGHTYEPYFEQVLNAIQPCVVDTDSSSVFMGID